MCKTHGDHAQPHRLPETGAAEGPTLEGTSPKGNTEIPMGRHHCPEIPVVKFVSGVQEHLPIRVTHPGSFLWETSEFCWAVVTFTIVGLLCRVWKGGSGESRSFGFRQAWV